MLDNKELSAALKEIRHGLALVLAPCWAKRSCIGIRRAMWGRPTRRKPSSSGRMWRTWYGRGQAARGGAAGDRGISQDDLPRRCGGIEQLRYRFYDIEQRIARTLRPANRFANVRLYVLITERCCRRDWLEAAEEALIGGADCLQLREKELEGGELLRRARRLVELCRRYDRLCIINDRADIAILSDADGVHVGQEDLPGRRGRKLIGRGKILGVSTHRIEQARRAVLDGADYIGDRADYPSATKPRDFVAGLEYARQVAGENHDSGGCNCGDYAGKCR